MNDAITAGGPETVPDDVVEHPFASSTTMAYVPVQRLLNTPEG